MIPWEEGGVLCFVESSFSQLSRGKPVMGQACVQSITPSLSGLTDPTCPCINPSPPTAPFLCPILCQPSRSEQKAPFQLKG